MMPNGKTLLTMGTYDPPGFGHAAFFKQCELYCERLIIGVNSDRFVREYRGQDPSRDQAYRMGIISRWHDAEVVLNDGPGRDLIMAHHPDIIAIGSDWASKDFYGQINFSAEEMDQANIALVYIPYRLGSEYDASASGMKAYYGARTTTERKELPNEPNEAEHDHHADPAAGRADLPHSKGEHQESPRIFGG